MQSDSYNTSTSTQGTLRVLDSLLYLTALATILWYIRWWWRTTRQLRNNLQLPNNQSLTRIQRSQSVQNLGDQPLSTIPGNNSTINHNISNSVISNNNNYKTNNSREGYLDIATESARVGPPNSGPFQDRTPGPDHLYSKRCYSQPTDPMTVSRIPYLGSINASDPSIDEQATGFDNGMDVSQPRLPHLITPSSASNDTPEREFVKDRRYRNRGQQLRQIADELQDRTRLSEDEYRAKYSWHNEASRCLHLPPGFGKLTPRKTEDGSSYEYAYTGDIRDAQLRTPMDILSDYPRKEWACNRPWQQCTAPAHLIGNAPEYYRQQQQRQIDQRNAAEQWQQSVIAQLPPQELPPTYPG